MKKILIAAAALAMVCSGCEQSEVRRYDRNDAMTEFVGSRSEFSFMGSTEGVVEIPFHVVGYPAAVERRARFEVVADSTTAAAGQYELLDAIVPAESFTGTLRVRLTNDLGADFEDVRIYLRTAEGDDFTAGPVNRQYHALYVTNALLVRPASWTNWIARYGGLGEYSTAYYAFIIEATGETEFPINAVVPGYNNDQIWTPGFTSSFLINLTNALRERNREAGSPLLHDDGAAAGYEVVVGKYTYP